MTEPFGHYRHQANNPNSLSHNHAFSFAEDENGDIWIGTIGGGLNRFDPKSDQFKVYRHQPNNANSLRSDQVYALVVDAKGMLWIGTQAGLSSFDRKTETFNHHEFVAGSDTKSTASTTHILSLFEDSGNNLWIGTYKEGLHKFDPRDGRTVPFVHRPENENSISGNIVSDIIEDETGNLWVGTFQGLNRLSPKTKTFTRYQHDENNPRSIGDNLIASLFIDAQGTLWVGNKGGLNRFDDETKDFSRFTKKDGLPNDTIYGILQDEQGYLWLSTNAGLCKFDSKTKTATNFEEEDGLQSNEFSFSSRYMDRSGNMYFGGINGFNRFSPKQIKQNTVVPKVVLTDFLLFNKSVKVGKNDESQSEFTLTEHINFTKKITLDYIDYIFSIEFSALNYRNASENQFAYKLEGFDRDWIETDYRHRRATYTDLPHGDYVFRVKASNDDGYWNEKGASIKLTILPPPWKTWWAYTLYVLVGLSLIFGLYSWRTKQLRQKQKQTEKLARELETQVRWRTTEVVKQKEEIQLQADQLQATNAEIVKQKEEVTKAHSALWGEMKLAKKIQTVLLPPAPQLTGFEVDVYMRPADDVGGDYYDIINIEGRQWVVIGDVSGHGVPAGLIMMMVQTSIHTALRENPSASPIEILEIVNAVIYQNIRRLGDDKYMTITLLSCDEKGTFYFSGLHQDIKIYRARTGKVELIETDGMWLGIFEAIGSMLEIGSFSLNKGDTMLLDTDGIVESTDAAGKMFSSENLNRLLEEIGNRPVAEIKQTIINALDGYFCHDDVTFMVIKRL